MSLALARKYRPRRFADVAVQSHVANTLRNAISGDRLGHAYLFCGPRGTGKTTLARVLAMALNCEARREDREPCGECASCTRIWSGGASLDVVEIDAASNRGVDDARELRERAMYAPSGEDRYKVYIVDEAHMLTREAWNALLKILEEPPPRVIFVFATTEPNKIQQAAAPVLSRMQRFDLKRIGPADVRARLTAVLEAEGLAAQPDALAMLARAADGSMRDALSLTDQVLSLGGGTLTAERVREALGLVHEDEHLALLDLVAERRAADVFTAVARLADHGVDFSILLADFADLLRAQLAIVLGGTMPDLSDRLKEELPKRAKHFTAGDLLRMLNLVVEVEPHLKRSGQQQMLFETLLVRFALLDRTIDLEAVLRGVAAGGGSGGAGGAGAPTARPAVQAAAPAPVVPAAVSAPVSAPAQRIAAPPPPAARVSEPAPAPPPRRAASPGASAPAPAPAAEVADRPAPRRDLLALDINRVAEHWDAIVDSVNAEHRALLLSSTLAHATPTAVTASGTVTLTVESDAHADIITGGEAIILGALKRRFDGVQKVVVKAVAPEGERAVRRLNEGAVKADRMAMLRKQSPMLDAAVDALDLELMD
ncbi:MAG: DNA polymerase III subunit gamma/tau [Gemmatimonadetes bacterium]|jgi:DNA polymerase-3 subunit gamma/tau|nr:DNA polymerase III subunit gamma/tau [Gemmatimonadota bacterium]MBP7550236.1 DNA polymerase III subunit gamma/tau [Gemmatimonadaceae bacterium]